MDGHVACVGEKRGTKHFLGKLRGKKPLGKSRYKWEYNIRMDLEEAQWEGMDWISLAQDSFKSWAPVSTSFIKYGEFLDYLWHSFVNC
jgi:hypothetical protein